jgi:serine/threonine protein kinase
MLLYQALSGVVPFWGGTVPGKVSFRSIFYDIVIKDVEFPSPAWDGVSAEAVDLARLLLKRDPERRITAAEALLHPWFAGEA